MCCTFTHNALSTGELWGPVKNQFFFNILLFEGANVFALRMCKDIDLVLQCEKLEKRTTKITSDTEENVENPSISAYP